MPTWIQTPSTPGNDGTGASDAVGAQPLGAAGHRAFGGWPQAQVGRGVDQDEVRHPVTVLAPPPGAS
jgi:hypothetical protein